ncbi:hypothetical protein DMP23_36050 [Amycolatopsis sp. A1MSW2902]
MGFGLGFAAGLAVGCGAGFRGRVSQLSSCRVRSWVRGRVSRLGPRPVSRSGFAAGCWLGSWAGVLRLSSRWGSRSEVPLTPPARRRLD